MQSEIFHQRVRKKCVIEIVWPLMYILIKFITNYCSKIIISQPFEEQHTHVGKRLLLVSSFSFDSRLKYLTSLVKIGIDILLKMAFKLSWESIFKQDKIKCDKYWLTFNDNFLQRTYFLLENRERTFLELISYLWLTYDTETIIPILWGNAIWMVTKMNNLSILFNPYRCIVYVHLAFPGIICTSFDINKPECILAPYYYNWCMVVK